MAINKTLLNLAIAQLQFLKDLLAKTTFDLAPTPLIISDGKLLLPLFQPNGSTKILEIAFPENWRTVIQNKHDELEQITKDIIAGTWPPET